MNKPSDMDLWYKYINQKEEPYLVPQIKNTQKIIQKSLDLHGFKIQDAFNATVDFIRRSHKNRLKKIIIVTGASGQIKQEFETWMKHEKLAHLVQYYTPKNSGSYEIKLRF